MTPTWLLPLVWGTLPLTAGPAAGEALDGWGDGPRTVASVLLWAAWAGVTFGTLVRRPAGLTALRVAAPWALGLAVVWVEGVAVACTGLAAGVALLPETATAYAQGAAYGDEVRMPLRTPPVVAVVAAPLAVALVGVGVAGGPLLLASGRWGLGAVAVVVGGVVVFLLGRSLHALSRRWLVLVPGGVVVHDPLTLADPVLLPRDRVARMGPWSGRDDGVVTADVRLGARAGTVSVELHEALPVAVVGRNRRRAEVVRAGRVLGEPARPGAALAAARDRRLPVG